MQFRESQEADVLDFIQSLSNESTLRGEAREAGIHHLIQCIGIQVTLGSTRLVVPPLPTEFYF